MNYSITQNPNLLQFPKEYWKQPLSFLEITDFHL